MKSTQQAYFNDLWCVAGINNVVNVFGEEFSVDDLLDLSDNEFSNPDVEESSEEEFASVSSPDNYSNSMNSGNFSSAGDLVSLTGSRGVGASSGGKGADGSGMVEGGLRQSWLWWFLAVAMRWVAVSKEGGVFRRFTAVVRSEKKVGSGSGLWRKISLWWLGPQVFY